MSGNEEMKETLNYYMAQAAAMTAMTSHPIGVVVVVKGEALARLHYAKAEYLERQAASLRPKKLSMPDLPEMIEGGDGPSLYTSPEARDRIREQYEQRQQQHDAAVAGAKEEIAGVAAYYRFLAEHIDKDFSYRMSPDQLRPLFDRSAAIGINGLPQLAGY